jgi:hypothetical protein
LRQAWQLDDVEKTESLIRNLARRLEQAATVVAASNLEDLDGMLTVARLGLPLPPRRSLACTNIIENTMGTHPACLPQPPPGAHSTGGVKIEARSCSRVGKCDV